MMHGNDAQIRLTVCTGCEGSTALHEALAAKLPDVVLRVAECLSVCTAPATLAAQAPGRATYVFRDVTAAQVSEVAAFVTEYRESPGGWIEDARPLGALRFQLVARVPAIDTP